MYTYHYHKGVPTLPFVRKIFKLTTPQVEWLESVSEKTGLSQVEIVRRALDAYAEAKAEKEQQQMFTPRQRKNIAVMAKMQNISETEVVREAIERQTRVLSKRRQKKS